MTFQFEPLASVPGLNRLGHGGGHRIRRFERRDAVIAGAPCVNAGHTAGREGSDCAGRLHEHHRGPGIRGNAWPGRGWGIGKIALP
jgi:hypothetical protein